MTCYLSHRHVDVQLHGCVCVLRGLCTTPLLTSAGMLCLIMQETEAPTCSRFCRCLLGAHCSETLASAGPEQALTCQFSDYYYSPGVTKARHI